MRVYIFLCLICWARSENKRPCLQFTQLNVKDSFLDLFMPRMEVNLMIYTRNNPNCAGLLFEEDHSLNVHFNTKRKTVWIIHGYRPTGSPPSWLEKFLRLLLNEEDLNIIIVDWNRGAATLIYDRAVKNTRKVAEILSYYIRKLLKHGASLDTFHFIGMSLGAHISGFVGKIFQGQLGRITGLDPAGPKFSGKPPYSRLHYTDAEFVDVIHTDIKGLGIKESLGHIDFYPNGGKKQPGCPKSLFSGIEFIKCDHQRAVHFFMASLETQCNFVSFPCPSYDHYKTGLCIDCDGFKKLSCPRLGHNAYLWKGILKEKMGKLSLRNTVFLDTTGSSPFCTYYFVFSVLFMNKTMKDGCIKFKLINEFGMVEEPRVFEGSNYNLQDVKILVQFYNDIVNISSIGLTYFQNSNMPCLTCEEYRIQRLMLKSLTFPSRPTFCWYDFVLKKNEEVFLRPSTCTSEKT
ncbi:PREDICTED: lipase member I [Chrysochloris asiatica]|uniref:Lipase member I n=1 Tax=Chrysochloris asiatica TaxID=185453 RepID=A0A9B0TRP1_CHRAS|nr:PREDICTED: lipase member I [Chrysochloris asiatica]